jgi:tight adherence protein C
MAVLFVTGLLFLAASAALLVRAVAAPRLRIAAQIRQIKSYGFDESEVGIAGTPESPGLRTQLIDLADRIGHRASGTGWRAPIEVRTLRAAGMYNVTPEAVQGFRVMLAVGVPALLLLEGLASGKVTTMTLALPAAFAGLSWLIPPILIRRRGQSRMDQVDRALPELIDVLTATVEAGLGIAGSLQLVADRFSGPLGQELRLTLQEQSLGLSTEQALTNMLERCDTPSVRSFVRAVVQGEALGTSIGSMMRNLAIETRKRRRQAAQEKIQKAPVKLLFPLVFLIFPSLLMVLLYPAFARITAQFGGG